MSKILVKHSSIHISDYELGDCTRLEYNFSVYDKLYRDYYLKAVQYIEEKKTLIVPRGVDIFYLENLLGCSARLDTKNDPIDRVQIKLRCKPRDNVQKEALAFMLGELKYSSNRAKSQLSVNLNTGVGKTYCSITTAAAMGMRSMIITSSTDWLNQWKERILEYTDTKPSEIFMLVGTPTIHRLLKRDNISQYKFILASHDTLKSYGDRYGWDKITELFKYTKIGLKFYDESHLNFDNMARIDAYTNTFKTYYVTATPARSDEDEDVIFKYYFKNVPAIDLFDEDNDPRTAYVAMRYNSHPNPMEVSDCRNGYGFDKNKYSMYITGRDNYYNMLRILIDLAIKNNMKNVFYIATNKAIDITRQWILENYPELRGEVGVYTSVVKENKAAQLNKKIILSTTKSLGAAVDIKGLKIVAVVAEPFKSEVIARQSLGRARDRDTFYIELVDEGFKSILRYYNDKKPIFEKYAVSTSEIKFKDADIQSRIDKIMAARAARMMINPIYMSHEPIQPISIVRNNLIDPISFL